VAEFNFYEAPQADFAPVARPDSGASLWQDGEILVARSGADFPDRCIKCNAPAEGYRFKRTLRWHPPAYYALLLNIIIYVIVETIVSRKAEVAAGLCRDHRARRRNAILVGWLTTMLGIALLIVGAAVADRGLGWFMAGGGLLILFGLVYGTVRSQILVPRRIEKGIVRLQKVDRDFLAPLPPWYA